MSLLHQQDDNLEGQVNDFLGLVIHVGVLFRSGLQLYLQDRPDEFQGRLSELRAVSRQTNELRWRLTSRFCRPSRLTRPRHDLSDFLASTQAMVSLMHATLQRCAVEQPEPALEGNALLLELAEGSKQTVDRVAMAARSHFREADDESGQVDLVRQAREETSRLGEKYRRMIFRMDLRLSHKNQLCALAEAMERVADAAANAADQLAATRRRRSGFTAWALGEMATRWLVLSIVAVAVTFVVTLFAS